jgi:hypothetical protein
MIHLKGRGSGREQFETTSLWYHQSRSLCPSLITFEATGRFSWKVQQRVRDIEDDLDATIFNLVVSTVVVENWERSRN